MFFNRTAQHKPVAYAHAHGRYACTARTTLLECSFTILSKNLVTSSECSIVVRDILPICCQSDFSEILSSHISTNSCSISQYLYQRHSSRNTCSRCKTYTFLAMRGREQFCSGYQTGYQKYIIY